MPQNIPSNRIEIFELHLKHYKNPFSDDIFPIHASLALRTVMLYAKRKLKI